MKYIAEILIPHPRDDYKGFRFHTFKTMYQKIAAQVFQAYHKEGQMNPTYPVKISESMDRPGNLKYTLELHVFTNNEMEAYKRSIIEETLHKYDIKPVVPTIHHEPKRR